MAILVHVLIAIVSLLSATLTYVLPSRFKLAVSQALVALTLATGTYLVVLKPATMVDTCMTGLVYLSVVALALFSANRKLALSAERDLQA